MNIKQIIFDLDGTLIDSAPSILFSLANTLSTHGIESKIALVSSIIGPPLRETLIRLSGSEDPVLLDTLTNTFKLHYDSMGYKSTTAFPGVQELLEELAQRYIPIYIATNKRLNPTCLILTYLGWTAFFKGVYALDCIEPPHLNKANMLTQVCRDIGHVARHIAYVGDKQDDGLAADANGLAFFKAAWGYDSNATAMNARDWQVLQQPTDLLSFVPYGARTRTT